ncbi:29594_t:CDS:2, partial [Gigaspora margarita]
MVKAFWKGPICEVAELEKKTKKIYNHFQSKLIIAPISSKFSENTSTDDSELSVKIESLKHHEHILMLLVFSKVLKERVKAFWKGLICEIAELEKENQENLVP